MRLALVAALVSPLFFVSAAAQALVATATPTPAGADRPPVARPWRPAPPPARVEVGITAGWPSGPEAYADHAAYEIEVGAVAGSLYVRWFPFDERPVRFEVEVTRAGRPVETVALAAASATDEYGVRLAGLARGVYEVVLREHGADGSRVVSAPVRVQL